MNALLAALVNGAVLSAVLVLSLHLMLWAVPHRMLNAATRYVLWWAVLLATLALPVAYGPALPWHQAATTKQRLEQRPRPEVLLGQGPAASVTPSVPPPAVSPPMPPLPQPTPPPLATPGRAGSWAWTSFPIRLRAARWTSWIMYVWLATSLVLLARLIASYLLLQRVCARAMDVPPPGNARVARWVALCGASRHGIRLASSIDISIPVAVGPQHPSILIPAAMLAQLDGHELDQIGLHEMAHLARKDDYALLLQRAIEALWVLHPVVRWIARQLDLERETACDDVVIAITGSPRSYATCLTRVVELSGRTAPLRWVVTAAEAGSHLAQRVDRLLDTTRHTGTGLLTGRLGVSLAVMAAMAWAIGQAPALVAFATPFLPSVVQQMARPVPPLLMLQAAAPLMPEGQELAGEVVEDSSGDPVASAELRFHQQGLRELAADLETDRAGRFRTSALAPGDYTVDLLKPNHVTATLSLRVPATGVRLRLVRHGVIEGEVTDAAGLPIPGRVLAAGGRTLGSARIAVLVKPPGTEALRIVRQAFLEEGGRYRISGLAPGQYALGLWYSGLQEGSGMQLYPDTARPRFFTVSGGEEYRGINLSVVARPAYRVSGKLVLPSSRTQFQVALGLPEQPLLPIAQTLTQEDGTFHFEKVPAGNYDLLVAGPTGGYTASESTLGRDEPLFGRMRVRVDGQDVDGLSLPLHPGRSVSVVLRAQESNTLPAGCPQTAAVSLVPMEPWAVLFDYKTQAGLAKEGVIARLAPGRFRLVAELGSGCYQVNQPVVDGSGEIADPIAVELSASGTVQGTLRKGSAAGKDYVIVLLEAEPTDNAQAQLAFPGGEGHFEFKSLRPGRYLMGAYPAGEASRVRWLADVARMKELTVRGGTATMVELPATATGERP